jgi:hypothetical protein
MQYLYVGNILEQLEGSGLKVQLASFFQPLRRVPRKINQHSIRIRPVKSHVEIFRCKQYSQHFQTEICRGKDSRSTQIAFLQESGATIPGDQIIRIPGNRHLNKKSIVRIVGLDIGG